MEKDREYIADNNECDISLGDKMITALLCKQALDLSLEDFEILISELSQSTEPAVLRLVALLKTWRGA